MRIATMTLCLMVFGQIAVAQGPGMRRQELQQQVVQRFMQNVRAQAGLSDEQFERFGEVTRDSFDQRTVLARREQALWRALEGQMRPGVAANADSLGVILDGIIAAQEERAALTRADVEQFKEFLDPVQRAQVMLAYHRLQMQIDRILQGRGGQQMRRQGN